MSSYLDDLNPAQREAAEYGVTPDSPTGGPLLIIAGAGTGKTNTLAYRVAHLIRNGADPRRILLLTFTRRASDEMIKRSQRILSKARDHEGLEENTQARRKFENANRVTWAGTFHAIGNRLLRMHAESIGLDPAFTVLDRSDSEDLMNKVRNDLGYSKKEKRFPKKRTCFAIYSHVISSQQAVELTLKSDFPWCEEWAKDLKKIFKQYTAEKQRRNILDYDDLLLYWYHAMNMEQLAKAVGKRFDHVLVDEYQDTNILQAQILLKMKPDGNGLTVVGDDAQSIYSFRAATVRNILDFPGQFSPPAKIITLERNYRSTQPVLESCNLVIEQAKHRFTKNLFSSRPSQEKPTFVTAEDEAYQVQYIVEKVLEYREAGTNLMNQSVLFRASHHSAELEVELGRRNIPFVKYGGLKFLEAAHIKDLMSVLRWVENPRDSVAAFRVLQLLEGVGPGTATSAIDYLETNHWDFNSLAQFKPPAASAKEWPRFHQLLCVLRQTDTNWYDQVRMVRKWYAPHLERIYETANVRDRDLEQLEAMSGNFPSRERFLTELTLDPPDVTSDLSGPPLLDEDFLILSTIHSAKGKEWNVVYVLNVTDGCIPSDMATDSPEQIEEERRLLYVAMTRAKDHLHLIQPLKFFKQTRRARNADSHIYSTRSRFIPKSILDRFNTVFFGREPEDDSTSLAAGSEPLDVASKVRDMWE